MEAERKKSVIPGPGAAAGMTDLFLEGYCCAVSVGLTGVWLYS